MQARNEESEANGIRERELFTHRGSRYASRRFPRPRGKWLRLNMATLGVFADPPRAKDMRDGFWLRIRILIFLSVVAPLRFLREMSFQDGSVFRFSRHTTSNR